MTVDKGPAPKQRRDIPAKAAWWIQRDVEVRAPGALYHTGCDDETDLAFGYDLASQRQQP